MPGTFEKLHVDVEMAAVVNPDHMSMGLTQLGQSSLNIPLDLLFTFIMVT